MLVRLLAELSVLALPAALCGQTFDRIRQFGSSSYDSADGIITDASGIFVAGGTSGTLPGQTSAGFEESRDTDTSLRREQRQEWSDGFYLPLAKMFQDFWHGLAATSGGHSRAEIAIAN